MLHDEISRAQRCTQEHRCDDAITTAGVTVGRAGQDINFATISVNRVAVSEATKATIDFAVSAGTSGDRLGGCTNIVTGTAIDYVDIEVKAIVDACVAIIILVITISTVLSS